MEAVYQWAANILFFSLFMTAAGSLLPSGKYEKYLRLFSGMVLILLTMQPLTGGLRLDDRLAYYFELFSFREETRDLNREILGIEKQRLERVIAGYESAAALDLEQMAAAAGFAPARTRVSIEKDRDKEAYGTVTEIYMEVRPKEQSEGKNRAEELNRLRRKVEQYYGLESRNVEIHLEE